MPAVFLTHCAGPLRQGKRSVGAMTRPGKSQTRAADGITFLYTVLPREAAGSGQQIARGCLAQAPIVASASLVAWMRPGVMKAAGSGDLIDSPTSHENPP